MLAFCVAEGIALGAISKFFDAQFGDRIVINAVLGTFGAFAGTLAAYKFFNIKVGAKFRTFVIAAMFGMVGLSLWSWCSACSAPAPASSAWAASA